MRHSINKLTFSICEIVGSAAKCHEYHEIFTNENNEHIRGSLMLIADSQ